MRRYDIVSGIFLILSIIDFPLAAPVLVKEKRQACIDVVHIPKDVITVLEKRGGAEELEKLMEKYFKNMENPVGSSDAHASSSSAPPRPDHGPTDVVQAPGPNPASSTTNQDPLVEPSGPDHESTWPWTYPDTNFDWNYWQNLEDTPLPGPAPQQQKYLYRVQRVPPSNPRLADEFFKTWKPQILESSDVHASSSSAPPRPDHWSTNVVQAPAPNPRPSNPMPAYEYFKTWKSPIFDSPAPNPMLADDFFKTWKSHILESSDAHASSNSAPPRPDHGSMNVVQAPAPNPMLADEFFKTWKPQILGSADIHASSSSAPQRPDHWSTNVVQAPAPNPGPSNPMLADEYTKTWKSPIQESSDAHASSSSASPSPDHGLTNVVQAPAPNPGPSNPMLADEYTKTWKSPIQESSDAHASSSSASPSPDHGLTNVVQPPAPNPGPSNPRLPDDYFKTWKPPILESSDIYASSSSVPPRPDHWSTNMVQAPAPNPGPSDPMLADEYTKTWKSPIIESSDVHASSSSAPPRPDPGSTNVVQVPGPNPASSTANPDPLMEPPGPSSIEAMQGYDELDGPLQTLMSKFGSVPGWTGEHVPQPNPAKRPLVEPGPDLDWTWGRSQSTKSPLPRGDFESDFGL